MNFLSALSRETKKNNKIHCEFFSSQADGPMCRPGIVLPEQISDKEFQVLLLVIKIIVETFNGATLGRRPMVLSREVKNEIHGFVGEISQNRIGLRLDEIKKNKVGTFLGNCGAASVGECSRIKSTY